MNWIDALAWFMVFYGLLSLVVSGPKYSVGSALADLGMVAFGVLILSGVVVLA